LIEFTNIRVKNKRNAKKKVVKLNKSYSDQDMQEAIKGYKNKTTSSTPQ